MASWVRQMGPSGGWLTVSRDWTELPITTLSAAMAAGECSAAELTTAFLARIEAVDRRGPTLRSVIELNAAAPRIATALDAERRRSGPRGPLHGIPILLKDNIDTGDDMMTTAGSLALVGPPAPRDAGVAAALRRAGAVLLGKTNLSEWANFRGHHSSSGWSGRGGLTRNPHILDRSAGGSSSGSGAAVAAGLCAAALGTETDGSIVSPATACGVVGLKPTVGLTPRSGVVPISHTQDSVGPLARTVEDAALLLAAIAAASPDPRDPATAVPGAAAVARALAAGADLLDPRALRGARLGVLRSAFPARDRPSSAVAEEALRALATAGAELIDPVAVPEWEEMEADDSEHVVLSFEFRAGVNAYLAQRPGLAVRSLAEVIAYNRAHARSELPFFGQELLIEAESRGDLAHPAYLAALQRSRGLAAAALDAALEGQRLDALVAPSGGPAWTADLLTGDHGYGGSSSAAARCGRPLLSVPAGHVHGLPVNITFMGRAFSEPVLIRLAHAFERAAPARLRPGFAPTLALP